MSETEAQSQSAEAQEGEALSFLDQAITATKQTEPDTTKDLLANLTQQAMSGTLTYVSYTHQTLPTKAKV